MPPEIAEVSDPRCGATRDQIYIIEDVRPLGFPSPPRRSLRRSRVQPAARRGSVVSDSSPVGPPGVGVLGGGKGKDNVTKGTHSPLQASEGASAYARTGTVAATVINLRFKWPNPDPE